MATFSAVSRQHILQAIAEHDARGGDDFLGVYGYGRTAGSFEHEGRSYPAIAVLGVAHRFATGRQALEDEFHGGAEAALALLGRRGFDVPRPAGAAPAAPKRARAASPAKPRTAAPAKPRAVQREEVVTLCPTCSMALPATGRCDYCD
ncbi:hypothetical protein EBM89_11460 [Cellulomonas triticagri]|uniref:ScoMcrA-like N-terminal head domain-containing protein n=1 Tax=Cellulomonas triticagri TaxID=2483352 RepID=A0A3M2J6V6_9CELL|nr:hypothetical protein EBM89_11460 [Cellulomonas triticagri]